MHERIRISIVEDYTLTRTAFKYSLTEYKDLEIVSDYDNAEESIRNLEQDRPDIILMDLGMPRLNGLEATKIIKNKYPEIKVIIITSHESDDEVLTALSAGANAYSLKDIEFEDLHNVIHLVNKGSIWLDPRIIKVAIKAFKNQAESLNGHAEITRLTEREKEVLKLLSDGLSNTQIAEELIISSHTAKVHVSNILSKLAVTDRVQAAVKAYKYNLC